MERIRRGFTLIEVSLFIAITGLLFIGIAVGTQNSIFQQRYNDSVQNFAEFLRRVYSEVLNVQNVTTGGRSEQAIYGKLVTFGESKTFTGANNDDNTAFSYNVIGKIGDSTKAGALGKLAELGLTMVDSDGKMVGLADEYTIKWQMALQNVRNTNNFKGAILVVRHPDTGLVYTYVMNGQTVEVNAAIKNGTVTNDLLTKYMSNGSFKAEQLDMCLNPNGVGQGGVRMDIRIVKDARNASGVEVIGEGGVCAL